MGTTFPEPRWAVPGLVAEGLNLLVGAPKLGKSWLCLGLATAIASGGVAQGKVPVTQGSVLYAALEDTPRRLQKRLEIVLGVETVPEGLHITTSLPRGADMIALVSEWLEAHEDARLVIVDVLRKVTPRSDGRNMYEADYDATGALKDLADRHSVAVIAVHHTRKTIDEGDVFNEVSGSTGLTGAADAVLIAKRARNTAEAVSTSPAVTSPSTSTGSTWSSQTCSWSLTDEPALLATMGTTRRKVLSWLADHHGDTPTQIAEATGLPLASVKQTVRRMVDDDQLDTDGEGHYFPPKSLSPLSPVSPTQPDGDTGDRGDGDTEVSPTLIRRTA